VKFSRTVEAIKVFGEIYISVVEVSPQSELMIPTLANLGPVEEKKKQPPTFHLSEGCLILDPAIYDGRVTRNVIALDATCDAPIKRSSLLQ
jgi:hypothetical protein